MHSVFIKKIEKITQMKLIKTEMEAEKEQIFFYYNSNLIKSVMENYKNSHQN